MWSNPPSILHTLRCVEGLMAEDTRHSSVVWFRPRVCDPLALYVYICSLVCLYGPEYRFGDRLVYVRAKGSWWSMCKLTGFFVVFVIIYLFVGSKLQIM